MTTALAETAKSTIWLVISQINLLLCLVNDSLDLRLIEQGKFVERRELFSPRETLNFITKMFAPQVEMHETTVEDGVARMREIPALEVADGETVVFERGGKHLMLMKPVGTPGMITLNFYSDDVLLLSVNTEFAGAME